MKVWIPMFLPLTVVFAWRTQWVEKSPKQPGQYLFAVFLGVLRMKVPFYSSKIA
jgi:hypothetical protein